MASCHSQTSRILRDPHDAEEAAQDALVRAWRYRQALQEVDRGRAWVAAIARNAALDYYAKQARRRKVEQSDMGIEQVADDAAVVIDALNRDCFDTLLRLVGRADRDLLTLRYVDDLAYAEIARRLKTPVGTIKVRLHRLRSRLKPLIEERQQSA